MNDEEIMELVKISNDEFEEFVSDALRIYKQDVDEAELAYVVNLIRMFHTKTMSKLLRTVINDAKEQCREEGDDIDEQKGETTEA